MLINTPHWLLSMGHVLLKMFEHDVLCVAARIKEIMMRSSLPDLRVQ